MARGTPAQQARRPAGIGVPGKRKLGCGRGSIDKRLARSGQGGGSPQGRLGPLRRVWGPRHGSRAPVHSWDSTSGGTLGLGMSAFGGKADVIQGVGECPLLAISRRKNDG